MAIIFTIRKFYLYVFGQKFRVETDYKIFVYLNSSTKFMILDWLDFLLDYNFYIYCLQNTVENNMFFLILLWFLFFFYICLFDGVVFLAVVK